jgi:RimJ/RimL family protein N-acetyltransferase
MAIVLETERLLLRHLEAEDADAIYEVIGDPVAMQYYPHPFSREDAQNWIERNQQRYRTDGYGLYAVLVKQGGKVIGDCGILKQLVEGETALEVGYHLQRGYWGHGYATEAARACMRLAFAGLGAEKVISLIRPENTPSQRVAERNGMIVDRQVMHAGLPHLVYAMKRSDYVEA